MGNNLSWESLIPQGGTARQNPVKALWMLHHALYRFEGSKIGYSHLDMEGRPVYKDDGSCY